MADRTLRLAAIRRIVGRGETRQQEDLVVALARDGFRVTQSTLSRDLRDLRVTRVPDGDQGYRYGFAEAERMAGARQGLVNDIKNGLVALVFSGNLLVIKTLPGHAASVARALDNLPISDLVGTIAGDDTVIAVIREGVDHGQCLERLSQLVPGVMRLSQ